MIGDVAESIVLLHTKSGPLYYFWLPLAVNINHCLNSVVRLKCHISWLSSWVAEAFLVKYGYQDCSIGRVYDIVRSTQKNFVTSYLLHDQAREVV